MSIPEERARQVEALKRDLFRRRQASAAEAEGLGHKSPTPGAAPPETILYRRDLPRSTAAPPEAPPGRVLPLQEAAPGIEVETAGSRAYVITRRLTGPEGKPHRLVPPLRMHLESPDSRIRRLLAARCGIECDAAGRLLFVDLETTGLGCATLFLVGVLTVVEDALVVRQYLARDYSEERAITTLFAEHAAAGPVLVSFNGKSFDLPQLRMRAAAHRLALPTDLPHLDLLHECRRAWRGRVPDCRLQTLERVFCGRVRRGDIPGAEIPEAYHRFVRTGHAAEMARILEHNCLDLVTLVELLLRLPAPD